MHALRASILYAAVVQWMHNRSTHFLVKCNHSLSNGKDPPNPITSVSGRCSFCSSRLYRSLLIPLGVGDAFSYTLRGTTRFPRPRLLASTSTKSPRSRSDKRLRTCQRSSFSWRGRWSGLTWPRTRGRCSTPTWKNTCARLSAKTWRSFSRTPWVCERVKRCSLSRRWFVVIIWR